MAIVYSIILFTIKEFNFLVLALFVIDFHYYGIIYLKVTLKLFILIYFFIVLSMIHFLAMYVYLFLKSQKIT